MPKKKNRAEWDAERKMIVAWIQDKGSAWIVGNSQQVRKLAAKQLKIGPISEYRFKTAMRDFEAMSSVPTTPKPPKAKVTVKLSAKDIKSLTPTEYVKTLTASENERSDDAYSNPAYVQRSIEDSARACLEAINAPNELIDKVLSGQQKGDGPTLAARVSRIELLLGVVMFHVGLTPDTFKR